LRITSHQAVYPGNRQAQWRQKTIDRRNVPASDDGESARKQPAEGCQGLPRLRIQPHVVRTIGDGHEGSIEIQE